MGSPFSQKEEKFFNPFATVRSFFFESRARREASTRALLLLEPPIHSLGLANESAAGGSDDVIALGAAPTRAQAHLIGRRANNTRAPNSNFIPFQKENLSSNQRNQNSAWLVHQAGLARDLRD